MELGELIDALSECDPKHSVYFDFCNFQPQLGSVRSYRGVPYDLAIGYDNSGPEVTVIELLSELRDVVGKTFEGYKGGEYTMDRHTNIQVANRGEFLTHTQVVRVRRDEFKVVLVTAYDTQED